MLKIHFLPDFVALEGYFAEDSAVQFSGIRLITKKWSDECG